MEANPIRRLVQIMLTAAIIASFCSLAAQPVLSSPPVEATGTPVTLNPPSNVTTTSLTLTWTQYGASGFMNYRIMQNTYNSFGCNCKTIKLIPTVTQTSTQVTGLIPDTTYYFMIRVVTATGDIDSNVVNITMPAQEVDTTPPTVAITSPQNITYGKDPILVNWTVDESAVWAGYSLDGAAPVNLTGPITLGTLSMGPHALTVYANDSSMNMGSSTVHFTVSYDATPPTVYSATADSVVEGGQITIYAMIMDDQGVSEAAVFYMIRGSTSFTRLDLIACPTCENLYEANFTAPVGIDAIIDYYLFASDGENNATSPSGAPGDLLNITVMARPPAVQINSPVNATNSSALLTWAPSGAADFQMYSIIITTQGSGSAVVANITSKQTSAYLASGLAANTTYGFTIRVYDSTGLFRDSETVTVTTLPNEPETEPEPEPEPAPSWLSLYGPYIGLGAGAVAIAGAAITVYLRRKA